MQINKAARLYITAFWLLGCVGGLWLVTTQRAIEFDPEKTIQGADWPQKIHANLPLKHGRATLLLISDQNCRCNDVSQTHRRKVLNDARNAGLEVMELDSTSRISRFFPAVPAALLLSDDRQILYAGPLSVGLACAISDGIVDTVIANFGKGYNSKLLVSDTFGCYCRLQ